MAGEAEKLMRSAIAEARAGHADAARNTLAALSHRTSATGRERAAIARFLSLAHACRCRADADCVHVSQALRLVEYLDMRTVRHTPNASGRPPQP
jgi:hypothetical protein